MTLDKDVIIVEEPRWEKETETIRRAIRKAEERINGALQVLEMEVGPLDLDVTVTFTRKELNGFRIEPHTEIEARIGR